MLAHGISPMMVEVPWGGGRGKLIEETRKHPSVREDVVFRVPEWILVKVASKS
jgi:hypothetical protein